MTGRRPSPNLTPQQLEERAAQRRDAAKLLPPGKVRDRVLQEAERDHALAQMKRQETAAGKDG